MDKRLNTQLGTIASGARRYNPTPRRALTCIAHGMTLSPWRFLSTMSTAISMAAAVAHLMELPGKMRYEAPLYVRLHRTLYPTFGRTAGVAEIVSVVTTGALAWWVRKRRPEAFPSTATAAACLAAAHIVFWALESPANRTMSGWLLDRIPSDWTNWRDQWEYSHAVRALLVAGPPLSNPAYFLPALSRSHDAAARYRTFRLLSSNNGTICDREIRSPLIAVI
jgi:hypothetical protein